MKTKDIHYKGYVIEQLVNTKTHSCIIYFNFNMVKGIAGDIAPDGSNNAISKAKKYIDSLIQNQIKLS